MKRHRILRGLKFFVLGALAVAVLTLLVTVLWNRLMPDIFGLHVISFWQALGLLVLSKILLRGWGPPFAMHWRHRMRERWEQMNPEEREKFRAGMWGRCGPPAPPADAAKG